MASSKPGTVEMEQLRLKLFVELGKLRPGADDADVAVAAAVAADRFASETRDEVLDVCRRMLHDNALVSRVMSRIGSSGSTQHFGGRYREGANKYSIYGTGPSQVFCHFVIPPYDIHETIDEMSPSEWADALHELFKVNPQTQRSRMLREVRPMVIDAALASIRESDLPPIKGSPLANNMEMWASFEYHVREDNSGRIRPDIITEVTSWKWRLGVMEMKPEVRVVLTVKRHVAWPGDPEYRRWLRPAK